MLINFSQRAHNANFEFDPAVRSLLDLDFYKFLMAQFIWRHFPDVHATFRLINRTTRVRLADIVNEADLRRQLDHMRSLRFQRTELVWLAGETFYGVRSIFEPGFIEWLRDFRLPDYDLSRRDGQFELTFSGGWAETTMWEIPALAIVNELRNRAALRRMSEFELDILYARAKARLWDKIERLRGVEGLGMADFGTRRRHSFLWQEYAVSAVGAELGDGFTGTSNALIAFRHNLEAIGTNAHELPMALTAIARLAADLGAGPEADAARRRWAEAYGPVLASGDIKGAQYEMLRKWQETYGGALRVMLPDTYGTTQFLEDAPGFAGGWTGVRVDSKDPEAAGEEFIAWAAARGEDPREKLLLFSDGLDVDAILRLHARFSGRVRLGFGWGTLLTNDFRGCHPRGLPDLDPISLVCKISGVGVPTGAAADGSAMLRAPAVKLSDNHAKATGPAPEVDRYRAIFGTRGVADVPVRV